MILDGIIAEITARLGDPNNHFADREVGDMLVTGCVWIADTWPCGLRLERLGERYTVRAWRHASVDGRRSELIRRGAPTPDEVRSVVVLGGLLPGADWPVPYNGTIAAGGGQL